MASQSSEKPEDHYQQVSRELKTLNSIINQMEEKTSEMMVESSVMAIQMASKIETIPSISAIDVCLRTAQEVEDRIAGQQKPNTEPKNK